MQMTGELGLGRRCARLRNNALAERSAHMCQTSQSAHRRRRVAFGQRATESEGASEMALQGSPAAVPGPAVMHRRSRKRGERVRDSPESRLSCGYSDGRKQAPCADAGTAGADVWYAGAGPEGWRITKVRYSTVQYSLHTPPLDSKISTEQNRTEQNSPVQYRIVMANRLLLAARDRGRAFRSGAD